jgi:phosphatidylinositol alpha-mannosyltransferase
MRIAITHPTSWPRVRRGAERFLHDLHSYFLAQGHEAVTLSEDFSKQRPFASLLPVVPIPKRFRDWTGYRFLTPLYYALKKGRFDVVQSLHFTSACAAAFSAPSAGHRTCYYITGPPLPGALRRVPPDRFFVRHALQNSHLVMAPSKYVADLVREFYGVEPLVIPVPVDIEHFRPGFAARPSRRVVLTAAAFDDRRKGARPLARAFLRLKKMHPDLRLVYSGHMSAQLRSELEAMFPPSIREDVEFAGVGAVQELPDLYRQASVTVLPSKWESYGMVLLESWACGTPVVAAAHGALPELVDDPQTGVLFPPGPGGVEVTDVEALVEAIDRALGLAQSPGTSRSCRVKAEQYAWSRLGPRFEVAYAELCRSRR